MDDVADRLDQASDALTALSRDVPTLAVAPGAFAAPGASAAPGPSAFAAPVPGAFVVPGLPARIGLALHDHWEAVLGARSREASVAAARVAEMARSVRTTRREYAETDEAVERRFTREL
ncbi:hypothetical protein [Paractinoplanes hotanensis]|uniref:Excreted virulence factor EspC (Type VII ESX diderm) n=1 Tax=Paractinoplanes hotanensis TaxID=2906497 RepID=A0ABT0Y036_9ACTN|nr:hypothetical protein [Actinoplanes hotanensis]MCM4079391.1 hypothetical protein [Actinoplanes hotanensis]